VSRLEIFAPSGIGDGVVHQDYVTHTLSKAWCHLLR